MAFKHLASCTCVNSDEMPALYTLEQILVSVDQNISACRQLSKAVDLMEEDHSSFRNVSGRYPTESTYPPSRIM